MIHLGIADDQNLFRQALWTLLNAEAEFCLDVEARSGTELLGYLNEAENLPDIVLIDISMPGMNGIELNDHLQKKFPAIRVIILSVYTQPRLIARMIESGADAYLVKNCDRNELLIAINTVYKTGFYINHQAMQAIQQAAHHKNKQGKNLDDIVMNITTREKQIMEMICNEMSTGEIASKLFLSMRTIEGHRNNLLLKTGCHNTAGLVIFAIKSGIYEVQI